MIEVGLLNDSEVVNEEINAIKKYGKVCALTDFAILLGANVSKLSPIIENNIKYKLTNYLTSNLFKTPSNLYVWAVTDSGGLNFNKLSKRDLSIRPVVKLSSIQNNNDIQFFYEDGMEKALYGEYPTYVVENNLSAILENNFRNNMLSKTRKKYTTDSNHISSETSFIPREFIEYEYNGEKFIRFVVDNNYKNDKLSNGKVYSKGEVVWIKVEPINWLVDREKDILISKRALLSGIPFLPVDDNREINKYELSFLKEYMDKYFINDIVPSKIDEYREEITILDEEQIYGKNKLKIFDVLSPACNISDTATILGGLHVRTDIFESYYCKQWTFSTKNDKSIIVNSYGNKSSSSFIGSEARKNVIRPVLINSKAVYDNSLKRKINENGITEIEYGYYPQKVASNRNSIILESLFNDNKLTKTNKKYTFLMINKDTSERVYETYDVYSHKGNQYVRVKINSCYNNLTLSNLEKYKNGSYVWLKVEPIKWYLDDETGIMISCDGLVAGHDLFDENGNNLIQEYLDNYMCKEMFQTLKRNDSLNNSYDLESKNVTEEEIIRGCIEANIPVFLHGRSSEGKSSRVKQIDPDLTIIYLRNSNEGTLCGKSVYNEETSELIDIKPTWLKKLESKCEREPDKIHVLFFDEITNALPSIQGMAFNIVLDKEVNGIWKLPSNVRIVASGNEINDSLSANQLAEPLFNRFAHVYIETKVDKWLEWANKNNIHPSIIAFIQYKKSSGLRTKYDGEKPNADPRKWEMASKILYKTGKVEMLRSLIGKNLTQEFISFLKSNTIGSNYEEVEYIPGEGNTLRKSYF